MNRIKCESVPSPQPDHCAEKMSIERLPHGKTSVEKAAAIDGARLRTITELIENEKWRELDSILRSSAIVTASSGSTSANFSNANDKNVVSPLHIVHYACRFNPPRSIVKRLVAVYPSGFRIPDKTGRLPLHHAAKWGSSPRLIKFLVELDPTAVRVKDSEGKTPIHHLCLHYMDGFRPSNLCDTNAEACMIQAMDALLEADLSIVTVEDNDEYTALEYAIESNASYRFVRRLQKATERFWKGQQKESMLQTDVNKKDNRHIEELLAHLASASVDEEKTDDVSMSYPSSLVNKKPPTFTLSKKPSGRSKYAMTA